MYFVLVQIVFAVARCVFAGVILEHRTLRNAIDDSNSSNILMFGLPKTSFKEDFFNKMGNQNGRETYNEDEALGLPLNPDDFEAGQNLQEEDFAPKKNTDPIQMSGQFEGDIKDPDLIGGRNGVRNNQMKWPNGEIPYLISSVFGRKERSIIARAIEEYHKETCIRFRPRTNEEDFVLITRQQGCFSMIGRDGGRQLLSLGDGCMYVGIVIHEFMHAVGFWHEQSRADRDDYVQILWENIQQGQTHNFAKYTDGRLHHLGEDYDYDSIMHYGAYDFTKYRNRPTILPKKQDVFIGQRKGFSRTDVRKINKLYNCNSQPKEICEDKDRQCKGWAELGECTKNPKWMLSNCKKSCQMCRQGLQAFEENETAVS